MNGLTNPQELDKLRRDSIIGQLKMKYGSDPDGFRAYLPSVAAVLDAMNPPPRPSKPPFVLTEQERTRHKQALGEILILQEFGESGRLHAQVVASDLPDLLLLVEHPHVYNSTRTCASYQSAYILTSIGNASKCSRLLASDEKLSRMCPSDTTTT